MYIVLRPQIFNPHSTRVNLFLRMSVEVVIVQAPSDFFSCLLLPIIDEELLHVYA